MALTLPANGWGRGPVPALLLHGFTGSRSAFDHLEPLLGDLFTATVVDLPGHAGAPLPGATGSLAFVETLASLARYLTSPMLVLGYSQGARVALGLAATYPDGVSHLVLESGSPGYRQRTLRERRLVVDEARARSIETAGVEAFMAGWESLAMFEGIRRLDPALRDIVDLRRRSHTAAGLAGALRMLGTGVQPSYWQALERLAMPVLLISGSRDAKFTAIGRRMARHIPTVRRVSIRGAWHAPHLERPSQYATVVREFVRGAGP